MTWHHVAFHAHYTVFLYYTLGDQLSPSCVMEFIRSLMLGVYSLKAIKGLRSMKMLQSFMRIGKHTYYFKSKLLFDRLKLINEGEMCCHHKKMEIVGPIDFDNETLQGHSRAWSWSWRQVSKDWRWNNSVIEFGRSIGYQSMWIKKVRDQKIDGNWSWTVRVSIRVSDNQ